MSSSFGKILAPIVIDDDSKNVTVDDGTAHDLVLTTGTYATVLQLADELQDQLVAEGGSMANSVVTVSSVGYVTIVVTSLASITWTDTNLRDFLGFSGSESIVGPSITAASQHTNGWYPGVTTRGTDDGAGVVSDSGWIPENVSRAAIAGSGKRREIGPSRPPYSRDIRIGLINATERLDRERGPKILMDRYRFSRLYWYPDREDGTVTTPGSQMDPGSPYYDDDGDGEYYIVTLTSMPNIMRNQTRPDYSSVGLKFNAEPRTS